MDQREHQEHQHHQHENHHDHHAMMVQDFKKRFWISLALTIPVLLFSEFIQGVFALEALAFNGQEYVAAFFASLIFFYGGRPFLSGLAEEVKNKLPGMMTLIGLAISVAYFYSLAVVVGLSGEVFFWELATLVDVMLLGHWIEMRSVMGASKALEELAKLLPSTAHKLLKNGETKEVPVEDLAISDRVIIKPGEKVPVDGVVIEGDSFVNEAMLTGESEPVSKSAGSNVVAGSINQDGSLTIEIKKIGKDTYLSQVMDMVKNAQASKSRTQNLANRAALWLTITAISVGLITFIVWLVISGDPTVALSRMVTVMVITCPHALGLAIPLVVSTSTAQTATQGLLIRDRNGFERARNIDTVIFDKTGTLTKGNFAVSEVVLLDNNFKEQQILDIAGSLEAQSEHPLASPITEAAKKKLKVTNFKSLTGKGVEGLVSGKKVAVVGPNYLKEHNIKLKKEIKSAAGTQIYVLIEDKPVAVIVLADQIREESKETVRELHENGIKVMMLTGDSQAVAQKVAKEIGIDDFMAEVLPEEKQSRVQAIKDRGNVVAMVGDGVNDAPALAAADVGIAIGAGTDVAAETADIILVKNDTRDVAKTIRFASTTVSKMRTNLLYATGYNIFAIPLAAGVLYGYGIVLTPAIGAALMSLSTVVVAINARMLKLR